MPRARIQVAIHNLGTGKTKIFLLIWDIKKLQWNGLYLLTKCFLTLSLPGDAYMRQLFHCLQWYTGSERVKNRKLKQIDYSTKVYPVKI